MYAKRLLSASSSGRHTRFVVLSVSLAVAAAVALSVVSLALAATPSFPDVPPSHPYYGAITDLAERGVIAGYPDGNFRPDALILRQQFPKMLVIAGGYPVSESDLCPFTDVLIGGPDTLYPDNYVAVAAAHHLTVGKTSTLFDPYSSITRYQVVTMVVRMLLDLQPDLLAMPPDGYQATDGWGADPLHGPNAMVAEYNGLLAGLDLAALNPYGFMTRGEAAVVLHNALLKLSPASTTTSASSTTTASSSTTSTTASTTTTTASTTTTTASTTTTTVVTPPLVKYAVAGVDQAQVTRVFLDQFGNPAANASISLASTILEGSNLVTFTTNVTTDANGVMSYSWSQSTSGAWGVEEVTASAGSITDQVIADVQWIYDDSASLPHKLSAVAGQQKIAVAPGYAPWSGRRLDAYLSPPGVSMSNGIYAASGGLTLTLAHTWTSGEAYFIKANSTDTDGTPNWMYNTVP